MQPSPSTVRIAGPDDYLEVWRLFLQGHNENGMFSLAPPKVEEIIRRILRPDLIPPHDTGLRGVIGVIGPVGALEGICVLVIVEYWYTEEKHLEEWLVFVDPEYRVSDHAKSLVSWMKEQTDTTGVPLITGIQSKERTQAKCRLYGRMLPKVGEFFFYSGKGSMALAAGSSC